jgi:hypothetical protein
MPVHKLFRRLVVALSAGVAVSAVGGVGTAAAADVTPVRMVVGSPVTDSAGHYWATETGFVGGSTSSTSRDITGTTDDRLYQRERIGMSAYRVPVGAAGTFTVVMHLSENKFNAAGKRVFDVQAEGRTVVPGLDVYARAGARYRAHTVSFTADVSDGTLDLGFVKRVDNAKVSSIQVTRNSVAAPTTTPTVTKPGADNTGVPAGTALTRHDGDLTITTAGAHIDALDIHGYVKIAAPNVRITRSIIRGGAAATSVRGLLESYTTANTGLVVEDSELRPANPSWFIEGAKVQNATLRRVEITGTVDGIGVHGNNVRVDGSWIHDLSYYTPFPHQADNQTHNDGIQVHLGSGLRVVGSTITTNHNAAVMVTPSTGPVSDMHITGNWLDHGGCTINVSEKGRGAITGTVVTDNKFGRNSIHSCPILFPPATGAVAETIGNVYEDDGTAVPIRYTGAS